MSCFFIIIFYIKNKKKKEVKNNNKKIQNILKIKGFRLFSRIYIITYLEMIIIYGLFF